MSTSAVAPKPTSSGKSPYSLRIGAGKSGATILLANVLKDACINMVMSRLPFALLKTHVMIVVRAVIIRINITMLGMVGGVQTPLQNRGVGATRPTVLPG